MIKIYIVIIGVLVFGSQALGQTAPRIVTGRPGQAIGPRVPGTGVFQVQSGLDFNQAEASFVDQEVRTLNNIFRMGLSESFEVSTVIDYSQTSVTNKTTNFNSDFQGVSQWQLGFRYNIIPESKGWVPGVGIQTRFRMKHISDNYKSAQVAPVTMIATNHSLSEDFAVNLNGGVSYSGNGAVPRYLYVVSVAQSFGSSNFGTVYEFYGNEFNDQQSTYLGTGVSYLANKDLQFDLYGSTGNNQGVRELYVTLGLSWRTWFFDK